MRICAVMKYPPIQGGVSAHCYRMARALAERGHQVDVVTNADEVEDDYRIWFDDSDFQRLAATFPNGGAVRVIASGQWERARAYIPAANPFATKLAALATEEIRLHGADLVFSAYLEPYGLSAHLAASWTGVPHVVQHAGSDRTRLLDHPELGQAYREVLRRADLVVGDRNLTGLGIPPHRIAPMPKASLPPEFTPDGPAADLTALVARLRESAWVRNTSPLDPAVATIGVYGKLGVVKGSYDLIEALARLRGRGLRFNFLVMAGGTEREKFLTAVDELGLTEVTWTLPFLPPWRVPEVLRACTAVCGLERNFPVEVHRPGLPMELLSCGTCAVLSAEVVRTQPHWPELRSSARVVEDPRDIDGLAKVLAEVIADPAAAVEFGRQSSKQLPVADDDELGAAYAAMFDAVVHGGPAQSADDAVLPLLRRHMPMTMALLNGRAERLLSRVAPVGVQDFATMLAESIDDDVELEYPPDTIREVVRFEQHRLWLAVDADHDAVDPAFPRSAVARRQPDFGQLRPVCSALLRIAEFALDVDALTARGEIVDSEPSVCAFHKRPSLRGRVFRLTPATRELLQLCDGTRTVEEITDIAARAHDAPPTAVPELLRRFALDQVVQLR
ncbi:glycosyltransferase [Nocardia iowensis]|uniref:Glycosyltransferase n=1 Tax=Nocardia iowensis TaxID=204891 RepID=A0ABX8RWI2_NOCIO|nr:glycosyltransferase [Nocardia iowensis]QXN94012.1 glycosyltransferase [Nocardia iowensis]